MKDVKITTLANGFRIVSDYNPYVESVFCGVCVATGSRYENIDVNGISHFLEHMLFKGTETKSYTDIAEIIEDIGGDINAYTSKDHTFYHTKTLKEYLEVSIDILSDIIQNSVFDEVELAKEKNVILQELYSSLDMPDDIIYDYYNETAYPNQALGRPIIGREETITAVTSASLRNYINQYYTADKMFLIVSGNFDYDNLVQLAAKYFNKLVSNSEKNQLEKGIYSGGYFTKQKDLEQIHIMMGFEASDIHNRQTVFEESVLNSVLGGGMSSRLFQEVREKQNLVYSVYSSVSNYFDSGNMYVYASTEPEKINQVIDAVIGEIKKICDEGITQAELDRAKINYKSSVLMSLESNNVRARVLARQMLHFNKPIPFAESIEMINAIELDDIKRTAKRIFSSKLTFTALGKVNDIYDSDTVNRKLFK